MKRMRNPGRYAFLNSDINYFMIGKEKKMRTSEVFGVGCFMFVIILCLAAAAGGLCVDYSLYALWGFEIPWYLDALIGIPACGPAIVAAIICKVIEMQGYETPFWPCKPAKKT